MKNLVKKEILFVGLSAHRFFAKKVWLKNEKAIKIIQNNRIITPCYHSELHIQSVLDVCKLLSSKQILVKDLGIEKDLEKWNDQNPQNQLNIDLFFDHLTIAFSLHDIGNLMLNTKFTWKNDQPIFNFANEFQLETEQAEKRSVMIAKEVIDHFDIEKEIIIPFIEHLILQTIFRPRVSYSEESFWLVVQLIDQIFSQFFLSISHYEGSAGYLNELYVASNINDRMPLSLETFLNFIPNRFKLLIPDETLREKVMTVILKHTPYREENDIIKFISAPNRAIFFTKDIPDIYKGKYK